MIAQELRVGNIVTLPYEKDKVHVVRGIDIQCLQEGMDSNAMMPIPLTEEWLEKFGFEKNMKSTWIIQIFQENFLEIGFGSYPTFGFGNYFSERWNDPMRIDYVHQLQNLYHALTGEEL